MARRLIESGVSFVEVTLGALAENTFGWDTHQNNFTAVKRLSAELDAGWGTLMKELDERGLLGFDDDPLDRRIRPHAHDQPARRPRSLPRRLDLCLWRRRDQGRPGLRQDERRRQGSRRRQSRCSRHPGNALCRRRRRSRREEHLGARPAHQNRRWHADSRYFELTLVAEVAYVGPQIGRVSFFPGSSRDFLRFAAARCCINCGGPLRMGPSSASGRDACSSGRGPRRAHP